MAKILLFLSVTFIGCYTVLSQAGPKRDKGSGSKDPSIPPLPPGVGSPVPDHARGPFASAAAAGIGSVGSLNNGSLSKGFEGGEPQSSGAPPTEGSSSTAAPTQGSSGDPSSIGSSAAIPRANSTDTPKEAQTTAVPGTAKPPPSESLSSLKLKKIDIAELASSDNVKLVMIIAGNANKNPEEFINGGHLKREEDQPGLLTTIGKLQAYNFGNFVKQRYGALYNQDFNETDFVAMSGSGNAMQSTHQTILAAMFSNPEKEKATEWNARIKWNPAPYSIDDSLLNLPSQKCPALEEINAATEKLIEKSFGEKKKFVDFAASRVGWSATPEKLAQIGSNIEQYALRNLSIPDWITSNSFTTNLYSTVLGYRFLNQIACAKSPECRHITSGYLLNQIARNLKSKKDNNLTQKFMLMSTSSDILASLLWSLGIETIGMPSGRMMAVEYRDSPEPAVRCLFTEFVDQKPDNMVVSVIRLPGCVGEAEWCPVKGVLKAVENETVSDWKRLCRIEDKCEKKSSGIAEQKDAVGGFNKVNIAVDCSGEEDRSGNYYCQQWAKYEYCKQYISVRDFYCRYTCLCDDKYKVRSI